MQLIKTWFDQAPAERGELVIAAIADAEQHYGSKFIGSTSGRQAQRVSVNYLRHKFTNYDTGRYAPRRHIEVLTKIGQQYPWLREECARQMVGRHGTGRDVADTGRAALAA